MTTLVELGAWWCGTSTWQGPCIERRPHVYDDTGLVLMPRYLGEIAERAAAQFSAEWNGDMHLTADEAEMHRRESARAILGALRRATGARACECGQIAYHDGPCRPGGCPSCWMQHPDAECECRCHGAMGSPGEGTA